MIEPTQDKRRTGRRAHNVRHVAGRCVTSDSTSHTMATTNRSAVGLWFEIQGGRGCALREMLVDAPNGIARKVYGANDAQGRIELLSHPLPIVDGRLPKVRGVDYLILGQYIGTKVIRVDKADYSVEATWTFHATGRSIPVRITKDLAKECVGPNRSYPKVDTVSLVRIIGAKAIPWQGECCTVREGKNAHERGRLTLK